MYINSFRSTCYFNLLCYLEEVVQILISEGVYFETILNRCSFDDCRPAAQEGESGRQEKTP